MQVRDDPGARVAGRGQRTPAESRGQVVGVNDPRAGAANRVRDLLRAQPAAQHPGGGTPSTEQRRVALEQLGILAEMFAHQPQQVFDGTLLAAATPVAVVQKQDHDRCNLERPPELRGRPRADHCQSRS